MKSLLNSIVYVDIGKVNYNYQKPGCCLVEKLFITAYMSDM
jgi:hypothetical protein